MSLSEIVIIIIKTYNFKHTNPFSLKKNKKNEESNSLILKFT